MLDENNTILKECRGCRKDAFGCSACQVYKSMLKKKQSKHN